VESKRYFGKLEVGPTGRVETVRRPQHFNGLQMSERHRGHSIIMSRLGWGGGLSGVTMCDWEEGGLI
jgi:hypothetical protein